MTMTTYRIVRRDDDSFAVEIARFGALPQIAAGFATEAEVKSWIAQDKWLWDAPDARRTFVNGKRRGFQVRS